MLTLFQLFCAAGVLAKATEGTFTLVIAFLGFILIEWLYMLLGTAITGSDYFELESLAFFLCGIGLTISALPNSSNRTKINADGEITSSYSANESLKTLVFIALGVVIYLVLIYILRDVDLAIKFRYPAAIASLGLLAMNIVLGSGLNGTKSWVAIGPVSFQPSEFVKVAFILVGAVTLEYLISNQSLILYIGYCLACIGGVVLLKDFGMVLIFFVTFIVIAYFRSGDIRTLVFIVTGAVLAGLAVLYNSETVKGRFATYRHVMDEGIITNGGWQQAHAHIYMASGGLFGVGIGNGKMRMQGEGVSDCVFATICEEMGLIIGLSILACFVGIMLYAIRAAKKAGSSFYAIASVSAATMLLTQLALNTLGLTDVIPFTGVTLPFVSEGGSSMLCCWGLLAYIRCGGTEFRPPIPKVKAAAYTQTRRRMWH